MNQRPVATRLMAVIAIMGAIACAFWPTFYSLIDLGEASDSATHAGFVLVAFFVILWGLRPAMAIIPIVPFWWGMTGLLTAGLLWFVGELMLQL